MKFTLEEIEKNKAIDFTNRNKKKNKHWREKKSNKDIDSSMEKEFYKHIDRDRKDEFKR